MAKKRILFLGGPAHQIRSINRAKELGMYVGVVDMNSNAPARAHADEFFQCSIMDEEGVLAIAKSFKPDGVTHGMVDRAIVTCAYVAEALNLPGLSYQTAVTATDKYVMIKAFAKHKVPHPAFKYITPDMHEDNLCNNIPYPVIIKPVDMQGSRGVYLAYNDQELKEAVKKSSAVGVSGNVLIEELMQGSEFSAEFIVLNGVVKVLQITGKIEYDAPYFVGTGVLQPARISDKTVEDITELIEKASKSLGLVNSLGNVDVMLTADGPKMIELAPRQGGCGTGEQLLELSTGVSFTDINLKLAMGEHVSMPENSLQRASCIKFILSQKGVVKRIEGIEQAKALPNVYEIVVLAKPGDKFAGSMNKDARIISVITSGANIDEAEDACDKAIATISVIYE